MVAGHGKFRVFLRDDKIVEIGLAGKFISESYAVVIRTEAYHHRAVESRLAQCDRHLVIVVADESFLSPYGLPVFINAVSCGVDKLETVFQRQCIGCGFLSLLVKAVSA